MLPWLALVLAAFSVVISVWALAEALAKRPAPAVAALRSDVADLTDAYERLQRNLRRMQMRLNAEKGPSEPTQETRNGDGLPDPEKDPEGWKREMRLRIRHPGAARHG